MSGLTLNGHYLEHLWPCKITQGMWEASVHDGYGTAATGRGYMPILALSNAVLEMDRIKQAKTPARKSIFD